MKTSFDFVIIVMIFLTSFKAQDINTGYISDANNLFLSGDYLFAAKLYKHISETATDSNIIAESLYKYKKCGDMAAQIFMSKYYLKEKFQINNQHTQWNNYFQPIFDKQLESYKEVDISIHCGKLFDLYCANEDNKTLNILSLKYGGTKWGELAAFELTTYRAVFNLDPRGVIFKSKIFLNKYPQSKYRFKVYYNLAHAYSDLWNFSQSKEYYSELSEKELLNVDSYRLNAIDYHQKIVNYNNDTNTVEKAIIPFSEALIEDLINRKPTYIFYFWGD